LTVEQEALIPNKQQVARAGELFVAAELNRRGAYAVTFAGNMPETDIVASDKEQTRTVALQVKTKRTGTWQATVRDWTTRLPEVADLRYWIFVDLKPVFRTVGTDDPTAMPWFYVVPEKWIHEDIDRAYGNYLARHGGVRAQIPLSKHHSIAPNRIAEWYARWDILQII
jgi:hypothetical protein